MKFLAHLPNVLTSANLLCGCIGIVYSFREDSLLWIPWIVLVACIFDFFDGLTARWLNALSPIGKELDSLADIVSFGVLPALVVFQLISRESNSFLPFTAFAITIFSALRLATFNVDDNQKDSFVGLPTPANALFITSLVYIKIPDEFLVPSYLLLIVITFISSFLLVSPIRMFALKLKNFSWKDNKLQFTFIITTVPLLIVMLCKAWLLIVPSYVIVSLFKRIND